MPTEEVPWTRVSSSNVWAFRYCAPDGRLEVEFNSGAVYHYFDVPERVGRSFGFALSKGRFVWDSLRGRYNERRVRSAETYAGPARQSHLRTKKPRA